MLPSVLQIQAAWILGVSVMVSGLIFGEPPASAADKVVVIPMDLSGAPAPVAKTGQTESYASRDDGELEKGVAKASGRFIDNTDGTVTDTLTGLIWLKEGLCQIFYAGDATGIQFRPWAAAVESANKLASGYCGLTDGSKAGDWRLPNFNEFNSLIDRSQAGPALPAGCPLADSMYAGPYWSSTTKAFNPGYAWYVSFDFGKGENDEKSRTLLVRAVRGGR